MEFFDFDAASESVDQTSTCQLQDDRELDFERSLFCLDDDQSNFHDRTDEQGQDGQGMTVQAGIFENGTIDGISPAETDKRHERGPSANQGQSSTSRFSKKTKRILSNWLADHAAHPYATEVEKVRLSEETGLTVTQISNWLANARRRGKSNNVTTAVSSLWSIPRRGLSPDTSFADLNPLERWTYVPPEREPIEPTDLMRAFLADNKPTDHLSYVTWNDHEAVNKASHLESVASESYFSTERESTSTDPTAPSTYSHQSSLASGKRGIIRRRRAHTKKTSSSGSSKGKKELRYFQCTFCHESYSTKYDWQRHEKSVHLALDSWTCTPLGAVDIKDNKAFCAFCHAPDPDRQHLEEHNYDVCCDKPCADRSFWRKDHLAQHLRLIHNVKFSSRMNTWRRTREHVKSRCGFCDKSMTTWKERVEHLASHFRAGCTMSNWKGGWGFEPDVEQSIQDAIQPGLVHSSRPSYIDGLVSISGMANKAIPRQYSKTQRSGLSYVQNADSSPPPPSSRPPGANMVGHIADDNHQVWDLGNRQVISS
ncbi:homeobox and C2H2 transcription factor [Ascosphaera apis ARSEF 7405]|uniref:Homeobox and C2H2 transcription factor n=1 Tax=Ascosphaera apis ARSEF 7405 TaxID=392613 RepID=A0A166NFY6_9EURO|nr:homeobox and C2H2 transcription factor [Ascosphaera apis ARSEF 7405]